MKIKLKHGQYFLKTSKGFFLFNTYLKRGRAFMNDGRVSDIAYKTHPKLVKGILTKGERGVVPTETKLKGVG